VDVTSPSASHKESRGAKDLVEAVDVEIDKSTVASWTRKTGVVHNSGSLNADELRFPQPARHRFSLGVIDCSLNK